MEAETTIAIITDALSKSHHHTTPDLQQLFRCGSSQVNFQQPRQILGGVPC